MTTADTSWLHPYQRGAVWYAYWEEDGKRVQRSLKVKSQRLVPRALVALAQEILEGRKKASTLGAFAQGFFLPGCTWTQRRAAMGHHIKPSTMEHYRRALHNYILPAHGALPLDQIDAATIEDLSASLPVSNSYRNEILRTYRIVMDEAARERLVPPLGTVDRFARNTRPKDVLTDDDLAKLFPDDPGELAKVWQANYAYEPKAGGLMWGALYMLMVSAGLRSGEARALEVKHLYMDEQAIAVVQAFDLQEQCTYLKKGGPHDTRARVAPIPERTAKALGWWLPHHQGQTPYLFEFLGRHIQRKLILDRFHLGLRNAGIDDGRNLTPHSLRYTYNTRMETKLPGEVLRAIVGHRSEAMTQHYSRPVIAERLKELGAHRQAVEGFWG